MFLIITTEKYDLNTRGPNRNSVLPLDVQSTAAPQRILGRTN